jgi:hypothetical protein
MQSQLNIVVHEYEPSAWAVMGSTRDDRGCMWLFTYQASVGVGFAVNWVRFQGSKDEMKLCHEPT